MALLAPVENGKIVETGTTTATNATKNNSMDKEAFLKLLVAQMQYQDPLEPTSNTEYIAQYAQFSQVESLQNMSSAMDLQRAGNLVGKTVYVQTTNSEGETGYVMGKVDYVTYEGGKAYVYINEKRYALSDVQTVMDDDYYEAYSLAMELVTGINRLPSIGALDVTDGETVDKLNEIYQNMNEYQRSFVAKEKVDALAAYVEKMKELRKLAEGNNQSSGDEKAEGSDKVAGSGGVEGGEDGSDAEGPGEV
ncbi:MAG: flagellar hook capping protein [Lachnospiraceae bacterium]|nr:flagellar hook capping protein [Lachnospiraceae bacterium]